MADDYDLPKGELMRGKRGLVMGVANHNSIAWGIAAQLAAQGAEVALRLHGEPTRSGCGRWARASAPRSTPPSTPPATPRWRRPSRWSKTPSGPIDFLVHAIAFADRDQIKGSFVENATRDGLRPGHGHLGLQLRRRLAPGRRG